ncbi:MAG: type III-B CRISPR module-associated protein Cmr5 [Desulfotomaculales bacterium]
MWTRNQEYAAKIFEQVEEVLKDLGSKERNKYGSLAHRLPVLIRTAGLAQALAFVDARGKDPGKRLLNGIAVILGFEDKDELLKRSREAELGEYLILTQRTLAALTWYKRFAQSVLGVEAGADEEERGE